MPACQPVVQAGVLVKPERVVETGNAQRGVTILNAMGLQAGGQQVEIRGVGEQMAVQRRVIRQCARKAEPQALACGRAVVGVARQVQKLNRVAGKAIMFGATMLDKRFGRGHSGHGALMAEALLLTLKRGAAEKDGSAFLDSSDAARREAAAIANGVYLVDDRAMRVAGA